MGGGGTKEAPLKKAEGDVWEQQQPGTQGAGDAGGAAGAAPVQPEAAATPQAEHGAAAPEEGRRHPDRRPTLPNMSKVGVIGLDGVGKTRIVEAMKGNFEWCAQSNAVAWERTTVTHDGAAFDLWVAGGGPDARAKWREVCLGASAVVLVVNLSDSLRLPLAWSEALAFFSENPPGRLLLLFTTTMPHGVSSDSCLRLLTTAYRPLPSNVQWASRDVNLAGTDEEIAAQAKVAFSWLASS